MPKKPTVYLAGGIEAAKDLGVSWRKDITPLLDELGFSVLDPTVFEPKQLKGLQPRRLPDTIETLDGKTMRVTHWHDLQYAADPNLRMRFHKYMGRVRRYDKRIVRNVADYVIVFWDKAAAAGAGTYIEMDLAEESGKPVYVVEHIPLTKGWLVDCCSKRFKTLKELEMFLREEFGEE